MTGSLPLGVDLGSHGVAVVVASLERGRALAIGGVSCGDVEAPAIGAPEDLAYAHALRTAVDALATRERRCVLAAPASEVSLRLFRVPPGMRPAEAERAASLEADSISPLPASERLVALDPLRGRTGEMLLSIARLGAVERLVAIARAAGLRPVAVDVPICAWRRAVDDADAILDWSRERATLTIFGEPIGSTTCYPPRLVEERLLPQVRSALVDARRSGIADVRRLAVLGEADRVEAAREHLTPEGYAVAPVTLGGVENPPWTLAYGLASWAVADRGVAVA